MSSFSVWIHVLHAVTQCLFLLCIINKKNTMPLFLLLRTIACFCFGLTCKNCDSLQWSVSNWLARQSVWQELLHCDFLRHNVNWELQWTEADLQGLIAVLPRLIWLLVLECNLHSYYIKMVPLCLQSLWKLCVSVKHLCLSVLQKWQVLLSRICSKFDRQSWTRVNLIRMRFKLKNVLVVTAVLLFVPFIFLSLYNERGQYLFKTVVCCCWLLSVLLLILDSVVAESRVCCCRL